MQLNPQLSRAGLWTPIAASYVSATNSAGLAGTYSSLIQLGSSGQYGLVVTGWGYPNPAPATPEPVSIAILDPGVSGALTLNTQNYVSDPVTYGGGSVIVADFNGDGRPDIVLPAHNEAPFVAEPSTAYMSNASGGFTKVTLPGIVMAHDAELADINGKPAIVATTFLPGDANPIFTYGGQGWVENLPPSLNQPGFGQSAALAPFGAGGAYEMVRGDVGFSYTKPGVADYQDIAVYGFNANTLALTSTSQTPTPIQRITPYLSTLPQYQDVVSMNGKGLTHTYRLWTDDLNHDGKPDILAGESMWSGASLTYPSALQVLINKGDGTFREATAALNPSMSTSTDELDYNPTFVDLDHSGIKSYLFAHGTLQGAARQSNYLVLNDGTGHLYVALHDEFQQLESQVVGFLRAQYPGSQNYYVDGTNSFSKFIGVPQADGSVNYVAEFTLTQKDASTGFWQSKYAYVNVPLHYNPTTDFTQNVTIADRNGSTLMRTWAGNDAFYDTNGGPSAHIDGGLGSNTSNYSGALDQYRVSANADGSVSVVSLSGSHVPAVSDTLVNIQTLKFTDQSIAAQTGGSGDDVLHDQSGGDFIRGLAGNDTLTGSTGSNTLFGGDGNDSISGGSAFNQVNGNRGDDTIVGHSQLGDWLSGGQGNDRIDATGSTGHNILNGNLGSDTVTGGDHGDTLRGGQGDDLLRGGSGNDLFFGDLGSNTITGGAGADTFRNGGGVAQDLITDFHQSEGDRVQIAPSLTYAVSQVSADVHIDVSNGDVMVLQNTQLSSLTDGWLVHA